MEAEYRSFGEEPILPPVAGSQELFVLMAAYPERGVAVVKMEPGDAAVPPHLAEYLRMRTCVADFEPLGVFETADAAKLAAASHEQSPHLAWHEDGGMVWSKSSFPAQRCRYYIERYRINELKRLYE